MADEKQKFMLPEWLAEHREEYNAKHREYYQRHYGLELG